MNTTTTGDLADYFEADGNAVLGDSPADVGLRIAEARAAASMDTMQLASRLGVTTATVDRWETGDTSPAGGRMSLVAGVLGVSLSWLMMGHGVEPDERATDLVDVKRSLVDVKLRLGEALADIEAVEAQLAVDAD